MIDTEDLDNTITVGFLDEKIEENLKQYNELFDIVLTENGTYGELIEILKID